MVSGFVYHGTAFPASYEGSYFFGDYTQNWIRNMTFDGGGNLTGVFNFEPASGAVDGPYGDIVYLIEGPDQNLYYLDLGYSDISGTFGVSKLRRISYVQSNQAPIVAASATPTSGAAPLAVAFSSAGSSDPEGQPLSYSWTFGDNTTSTAANPGHTYSQPGIYTARLSVSDGVNTSQSTPITISVGNRPVATIASPLDGSFFVAGNVISYSGNATDTEDGTLPASAFTWNVDFLHEGHVHPGTPVTGVKSGSFTIPTTGHDFSGNTRYRITLTVTDSNGLTDTKSVTVWPSKVNLTFGTAPSGLTLYLDGIAKTAPFVYDTLDRFQPHHRRSQHNQWRQHVQLLLLVGWRRTTSHDRGSRLRTVVHRHLHGGPGTGGADHLRASQQRDPTSCPEHRVGRLHDSANSGELQRRRRWLERHRVEHHRRYG